MTQPATLAAEDGVVLEHVIKSITKGENYHYYTIDGTPYLDLRNFNDSSLAQAFSSALQQVVGNTRARVIGLRFPVESVASLAVRLRGQIEDDYDSLADVHAEMVRVFEIIDEHAKDLEAAYTARRERGVLESEDTPRYFTKDMEVIQTDGDVLIAGIIRSVKYTTNWYGSQWLITIAVVHVMNGSAQEGLYNQTIPDWGGVRPVDELPLRPLTPDDKARLTERAALFKEIVAGPTYLRCTGPMAQSSWFGTSHYRAEGRVMVDANTCKRVDSDRARNELRAARIQEQHTQAGDEAAKAFQMRDEDLWRAHPYVLAFSFRCKKWGTISLADLQPIQWRDDAFEHLVMDREQKALIRALVQNAGGGFQDLIDEKGGGTIFLLEGPPGEGKTLTAESVAELRRQPLYAISIGELGTEPDVLEDRLREILDVATVWNAVLLLDEADIFLEARNANDIVRNAMVGVFLRLLEYHQGTLFLTTNRANNLDPAFVSRISVLLSFAKGDTAKRQRIWHNLLRSAGLDRRVSNEDLQALAARDINGRQIKNAIRIGQTLARAEGRPLRRQDLERPLQLAEAFQARVRASTRRGFWARLRGVFGR